MIHELKGKLAARNPIPTDERLLRLNRSGARSLIMDVARSYDGKLMNIQLKPDRSLYRSADGRLFLAIVLLALCVCVQAVRAKASHYAGTSPQTRYFAASIKVAKFVPLEVVAPQIAAIAVPHCTLQEPSLMSVLPAVEFTSPDAAPPASAVLLRSPPVTP
ncbi:MAG: hypothetical protein WAM91_08020 [Candidatus Acidiferrales bacterium]